MTYSWFTRIGDSTFSRLALLIHWLPFPPFAFVSSLLTHGLHRRSYQLWQLESVKPQPRRKKICSEQYESLASGSHMYTSGEEESICVCVWDDQQACILCMRSTKNRRNMMIIIYFFFKPILTPFVLWNSCNVGKAAWLSGRIVQECKEATSQSTAFISFAQTICVQLPADLLKQELIAQSGTRANTHTHTRDILRVWRSKNARLSQWSGLESGWALRRGCRWVGARQPSAGQGFNLMQVEQLSPTCTYCTSMLISSFIQSLGTSRARKGLRYVENRSKNKPSQMFILGVSCKNAFSGFYIF